MSKNLPPVAFEVPDDLSTLPKPPVPEDLDLRHFDSMHLNTRDLLDSEIWDECSDAEIATALRFWARAWQQVPCSSLPNDERKLRKWAGCEGRQKRWISLRKGALRGFRLCMDGRIYHHKVAEAALLAASRSKAGKTGAKVRWQDANVLNSNNTGDASAYGKHDGAANGKLNGKGHSKTDSKSDAEKGRDNFPLYPPSESVGGEGSGDAHPHRPTTSYEHGVELADGRVCVHYPLVAITGDPDRTLWVDKFGGFDYIDSVRGLEDLSLPRRKALDLRITALASRTSLEKLKSRSAAK